MATKAAPKSAAKKAAAPKTAAKATTEQWTPAPEPVPAAPPAAPSGGSDDKTLALLSHLLGIITGFLGPLILWLVKKDQSPFVERHAREALNFQITVLIASLVAAVLWLILIGVFLSIAIWVTSLIFGIIATIAASKGQEYRYPMTLRLVKGPHGQQ